MLKSSDKSDQAHNDKLGIVSSTKSDNNEFNDKENAAKPIAALASFPGSGNTWLRYLLQQATGILTGSVYKDYGLLKSGFPAESISNSSVLMVKTHEWGTHGWEKFGKAVLLIRDPAKAILAEFNRQSGGHVGFASPDRYKRTNGKCELNFPLLSFLCIQTKGWSCASKMSSTSFSEKFWRKIGKIFFQKKYKFSWQSWKTFRIYRKKKLRKFGKF